MATKKTAKKTATKKASAKKTSSAPKKKRVMVAPFRDNTKLFETDGSFTTVGEWAKAASKDYGVSSEDAKKVLSLTRQDLPFEAPEDMKVEDAERFASLRDDLTAVWQNHLKGKAKYEAKIEEEKEKKRAAKEAEKKRKEEMGLQLTKAREESWDIVKPLSEMVDDSVKQALGSKFSVRAGKIVLAKSAKEEDLVSAFAQLGNLVETSTELREKFAVREAQLAIAAEKRWGDDWINFFSDNPNWISRIKKYMKVVKEEDPEVIETIPLNNLRALTEAKYSEDKSENEKLKKEAVKEAMDRVKKNGRITQVECREIANEKKVTDKAKKASNKRPSFLYIALNAKKDGFELFYMGTLDKAIAAGCEYVIELKTMKTVNPDGTYESEISPPTPAQTRLLAKRVEELGDDEEEETSEEEDEDVVDVDAEEVEEDSEEEFEDEEEETDDEEEEEFEEEEEDTESEEEEDEEFEDEEEETEEEEEEDDSESEESEDEEDFDDEEEDDLPE